MPFELRDIAGELSEYLKYVDILFLLVRETLIDSLRFLDAYAFLGPVLSLIHLVTQSVTQ